VNKPLHNAARDRYDPAHFAVLYDVEDRHFWFRARRHIIRALVSRIAADAAPGYLALEAGCGNGNVLQALQQACPNSTVIGVDLFPEGLRYARQRASCSLVQGDVGHLPFRRKFHLIGCFDVLEHQPDDLRVLEDMRTMLAQDGVLVVTVPAHPSLWSYFDEASGHCRRYGLADLEARLTSAGYEVEYITYFMMSTFPLIWITRKLNSPDRSPGRPREAQAAQLAQGELRIIPVLNNFLAFLLSAEARLIVRRRRLPVGTSLLAVARKSVAADR
jgi:SAM-dependent methyltransferase